MRTSLVVALALCASCGKGGGAPVLTAKLMPPGAEKLVLGTSVEADALAVLPGATIDKDKSLGGSGVVMFNDHAVEVLHSDAGEITLRPDDKGTPRLLRVVLQGPGRCDWVKQNIASLPGAETCHGTNRRSGDHGGEMLYCLQTEAGARVWVECIHRTGELAKTRGDELSLWLLDS
jgi:hypothetical protein